MSTTVAILCFNWSLYDMYNPVFFLIKYILNLETQPQYYYMYNVDKDTFPSHTRQFHSIHVQC